jgi:hypothetical protein
MTLQDQLSRCQWQMRSRSRHGTTLTINFWIFGLPTELAVLCVDETYKTFPDLSTVSRETIAICFFQNSSRLTGLGLMV